MPHRLITQRCKLVNFNQLDDQQIIDFYLKNAEHLRKGGGPRRQTNTQVQAMLDSWRNNSTQNTDFRFFVVQQDKVIGSTAITNIVRGPFQAAYLGYNMSQDQQGKGLMTEALTAVIDYAFNDLNIHRLMANYRPENIASARVLEKLNFVKEGYAKNYLMVDGQWSDHVLTSLTNPTWIDKN